MEKHASRQDSVHSGSEIKEGRQGEEDSTPVGERQVGTGLQEN